MLVLSRKLHDRVFIGDEIEVVIVGIRGNRVQLAIQAPADVPISRDCRRESGDRAELQTESVA